MIRTSLKLLAAIVIYRYIDNKVREINIKKRQEADEKYTEEIMNELMEEGDNYEEA